MAYFIENYYLPFVQKELRPSTYKDYKKDVYEKHLKIRLGELRLRDFRTVNGQRMLRDISTSNPIWATRPVAVISVAAFAGLRLAEIRGLRWSDHDGQSLATRRAVWRTHVGDTKNPTSEGTVPVLPILKRFLTIIAHVFSPERSTAARMTTFSLANAVELR